MKNPYLELRDVHTIPMIDFDAEGYPSNLLEIMERSEAPWQHASGRTYARSTRAWLCSENTIENIEGRTTTLIHGEVEVIQYDDGDAGHLHYRQCDKSYVVTFEKPMEYKRWLGVPADESVRKQRIVEGRDQSTGCTIS